VAQLQLDGREGGRSEWG